MAEIKFNKAQINNYLEQNKIQLGVQDRATINSIFDECDVENEQGQSESDGMLSRDEVCCFMNKVTTELRDLAQHFINFINGIANNEQETNQPQGLQDMQGLPQNREIREVECKLNEQERATYKQNLQKAKDICNQNKELLGLTDEELAFINNADIVSEAYGAARFDRATNSLLFNYNTEGDYSSGTLFKVLIHEATHATVKSQYNSQEEERQCETRALTMAYELFKQGKIDDFKITKNICISQLNSDGKISQFVEQWLQNDCYKNLPKK